MIMYKVLDGGDETEVFATEAEAEVYQATIPSSTIETTEI